MSCASCVRTRPGRVDLLMFRVSCSIDCTSGQEEMKLWSTKAESYPFLLSLFNRENVCARDSTPTLLV